MLFSHASCCEPRGDRPFTPRPGGSETGVYIFELYYTASKGTSGHLEHRGGGISPSSMFN